MKLKIKQMELNLQIQKGMKDYSDILGQFC